MSGPVGMVVAIATSNLLIILHECGHYLVARWCRIPIERFRLGFGPVLLAKASRKTATKFELALVPGPVRFVEEFSRVLSSG